MRDYIRQGFVVLGTIAMIVVNALASALPLNGQTTAEISDRFKVYFVPAGYVFSIWGLIYLGLLAYTVFQALPAQRENPRLRRTGYLYVLTSVANIAWLFMWHYEQFVLSLVAMVLLLLLLIVVYLRLGIGRTPAPKAETWLVRVPFSIYLGWITVATIANATSLLDYSRWDGWGIDPVVWAIVMLIVGGLIAAAVSLTRGDTAYVLVIVWAFVGITVKHSATLPVAVTAAVMASVVALTLLVGVPLYSARLKRWAAEFPDTPFRDRW